ncbi:DNA polymerase/3'-5' exonuclease PolX [Panacibacter ginsenosidivorans]|uniref:DNA polymerase/3'-5' exonuclease PolX n=1 Tax=Panacibacter ginsenosidivorans TaxID=1813871 RepID=A0A5B8V7B5_9BACT|nr:DNA polymerase/3'-5' exonuclease PolX [Panacibacter ginsenosidivorans]QEC67212.1 DNA polymerase/3'-5' exonuclease PolX [Panacibacter ginsenosidivorans]
MDNYAIADNFSLLAKVMDIHGENSFKTKSYSSAAFTIEKLPVELSSLPADKIFGIKGIGETIGKKIIEQMETGRLALLDDFIAKTPHGLMEMLAIKGIGPKKIAVIWKDLEVESLGELLYACNENRLLLYKGFGEKTQQNIKEAIEFYLSNQGSYLYAQIEKYATEADAKMKTASPSFMFELCGDFRRHLEIIEKVEWVTTADPKTLRDFFTTNEYEVVSSAETESQFKGKENVLLVFYHTTKEKFYQTLFEKSCAPEFLEAWVSKNNFNDTYNSEDAIFENANVKIIPPYLRESKEILTKQLPVVIQDNDITAIIHSHSKWSDGANTIEEMAVAAKEKGLQYLVISDHSKTAFYAQGLTEDRLIAQHKEVDELNKKLAPFKIFKSIESDILNDGNLDYTNEVLATFAIVIASVHSNLKMKEDKAMMRLINAIENPYTSILGHPTGRLLLSRNGYPVDHKKIIDACAANNVVIELNAHPKRLDIDWRWIHYCLEKNVLISIDPDAHSIEGYHDIHYGVLAAQKAGVTKENNLSSFSLEAFEAFLKVQQAKRK